MDRVMGQDRGMVPVDVDTRPKLPGKDHWER